MRTPLRLIALLLTLALGSTVPRDVSGQGVDDAQGRILSTFQNMLEAHVAGDPAAVVADMEDTITVVFNGAIRVVTREQESKTMEALLQRLDFDSYTIIGTPRVYVSPDNLQGFIVARTSAKGTRTGNAGEREAFEYATAWMVAYRRHPAGWRRVAVSTSIAP